MGVWNFLRAGGKIDGITAGAKRMVGLGNSHRRGLVRIYCRALKWYKAGGRLDRNTMVLEYSALEDV